MLTKTKAAIVTTLFLSLGAQADTILKRRHRGRSEYGGLCKNLAGAKI